MSPQGLHSPAEVLDKGDGFLTPVTAWRVLRQKIEASLVLDWKCAGDNDKMSMLADHAANFEAGDRRLQA